MFSVLVGLWRRYIRKNLCNFSSVKTAESTKTSIQKIKIKFQYLRRIDTCRTRRSFNLWMPIQKMSQSQWPHGLRRRSTTARLLRSWVRIPPGAWIFVCCECCVLSGRGLCYELITRPEESYRLWCVVVCGLETPRMRSPWPTLGCSATEKKIPKNERPYTPRDVIDIICSATFILEITSIILWNSLFIYMVTY